jgi:hypothetical protein
LVGKFGDPIEIQLQYFRIAVDLIRQPEASHYPVIEKGVIIAILTAETLAQ